MRSLALTMFVLAMAVRALADVVSYEGTAFPEAEDPAWGRSFDCTPGRWMVAQTLVQFVEVGECFPLPGGDKDLYTRSVAEFEGSPAFFAEFRCRTDGPESEFVGRAPAAFDLWTRGPVGYHFTVARDRAKLTDNDLVTTYADLGDGIAHTFRIEIFGGEWYEWYVDGALVVAGVPTAPYPAYEPAVNWRVRAYYQDNTVWLDYIRYGDIPADGSGDFDTSGTVDGEDFYFFGEYFSGEGVDAGPGGRWADFDGDTDVDCGDWGAFQGAWSTPASAPVFYPCLDGTGIPTVSEWGVAIMVLLVLTSATLVYTGRPARSA